MNECRVINIQLEIPRTPPLWSYSYLWLLRMRDSSPGFWCTCWCLNSCSQWESWRKSLCCCGIGQQYKDHVHFQTLDHIQYYNKLNFDRLLVSFFVWDLKRVETHASQLHLRNYCLLHSRYTEWTLQWFYRIKFSLLSAYWEYCRISDEKLKHWNHSLSRDKAATVFSDYSMPSSKTIFATWQANWRVTLNALQSANRKA